jgi:hypothetical protein
MARPLKSGLDYFPLDVHDDDKLKFVRIKFKITGVAIVFELYRKIYANSFFTEWSHDEALMFSDSIKADYDQVLSVVDECLSRGIFNKSIFDSFGILTSKGIQDRFGEATIRRKNCKYNFDYFVNDSKLYTSRGDYVNTNGVNVNINPSSSVLNVSKSTQSKVKESKVKESKEESKNTLVNPTDKPKAKNEAVLVICREKFEIWWKLYKKDTNKKQAFQQWVKLKDVEMDKCINVATAYSESREKKYRKSPHLYIRDKLFNDEIIIDKPKLSAGVNNLKDILQDTQMQNLEIYNEPQTLALGDNYEYR